MAELREQGVVREALTPTGGPGVIGIFEGPGLDAVQAQVERLPFVASGLRTFEYTGVTEL